MNDPLCLEAAWWETLVTALGEFAGGNGFSKALLGLSGGMDSSLAAVIAAKALGPEHVLGVIMPSPYSTAGSITDALALASNLSMPTITMPIADLMETFKKTLAAAMTPESEENDHTEENIQSRIRGTLLMALSNKKRSMLIATGNKSELGVGYCTLYGDMAGAIAPLGDLTKTKIYRLARWVNDHLDRCIPETVFTKPPSAELRPGQTDQDNLPPYEQLDPILERWLNGHPSLEQMGREGFDLDIAETVINLAVKNRFKILQAPPVIALSDTTLDKSLF